MKKEKPLSQMIYPFRYKDNNGRESIAGRASHGFFYDTDEKEWLLEQKGVVLELKSEEERYLFIPLSVLRKLIIILRKKTRNIEKNRLFGSEGYGHENYLIEDIKMAEKYALKKVCYDMNPEKWSFKKLIDNNK